MNHGLDYGDDLFREIREAEARAARRRFWGTLGRDALVRLEVFALIFAGGQVLLAVRSLLAA